MMYATFKCKSNDNLIRYILIFIPVNEVKQKCSLDQDIQSVLERQHQNQNAGQFITVRWIKCYWKIQYFLNMIKITKDSSLNHK